MGTALRLATLPMVAPFLESPLFGAFTKPVLQWTYRAFAERGDPEIERLARLSRAPNSGLAFRRTVSACIGICGQRHQTWDHIHRIEALPPIALFWGARDSIIPIHHAREAARRLGNVTVTEYPRCGHSPHLEAPELFAEDLRQFLEDRSRQPAHVLPAAGEKRVGRPGRGLRATPNPAKAA